MSGTRSRNKGKRAEREWAELVKTAFIQHPQLACAVRRSGWLQAGSKREGGIGAAPDVQAPLIWSEVKSGPAPSIRAALRQACLDVCGDPQHRIPIAAVRDDGAPGREPQWTVTMRSTDFFRLLAAFASCGEVEQ